MLPLFFSTAVAFLCASPMVMYCCSKKKIQAIPPVKPIPIPKTAPVKPLAAVAPTPVVKPAPTVQKEAPPAVVKKNIVEKILAVERTQVSERIPAKKSEKSTKKEGKSSKKQGKSSKKQGKSSRKQGKSSKKQGKSSRKSEKKTEEDSEEEHEEEVDVVDPKLVKVMGNLDDLVDKAKLEKEIEAMKSDHEMEKEELPTSPPPEVRIAEDQCVLYITNTTEYNKERQRRKAEMEARKKAAEAKKNGKAPEASNEPPANEPEPDTGDEDDSYRPNF
ncbi:hypothetical protein QR680_012274 [Steinernema hermaphroditum]|uniref:Uncharacterized protein n=1 Tax=Steinernema hermaphroditum TaxID=289476 RepID=A0AA39I1H6_9BILA|nr:hypothetical protein QR680_012274 [Steinernema hermaphroditum]